MRLGEGVELYLDSLKEDSDHKEQAEICLKRFASWFEVPHDACKRPVAEIHELRRHDLIAYQRWRETQPGKKKGTQLSAFTVAKEFRYVKAWLQYTYDDRMMFGIPWDGNHVHPPAIPRIDKPDQVPRSLEIQQLDQQFRACEFARYPVIDGITPQLWWFSLLYLAYSTAMRRRALFTVPRPTEEQLLNTTLYLPYTGDKAKSDRFFHLTPLACELIRKLPARPGEPLFVWRSRWGRRDFRSFYTEAQYMQERAGITGDQQARLHTLRKTSLTHMAMNGAELQTVQQQAGHSSPDITARYYLSRLTEQRKEAVATLAVPVNVPGRQKLLFD